MILFRVYEGEKDSTEKVICRFIRDINKDEHLLDNNMAYAAEITREVSEENILVNSNSNLFGS